jgi:hypothetical protein
MSTSKRRQHSATKIGKGEAQKNPFLFQNHTLMESGKHLQPAFQGRNYLNVGLRPGHGKGPKSRG